MPSHKPASLWESRVTQTPSSRELPQMRGGWHSSRGSQQHPHFSFQSVLCAWISSCFPLFHASLPYPALPGMVKDSHQHHKYQGFVAAIFILLWEHEHLSISVIFSLNFFSHYFNLSTQLSTKQKSPLYKTPTFHSLQGCFPIGTTSDHLTFLKAFTVFIK